MYPPLITFSILVNLYSQKKTKKKKQKIEAFFMS